MPKLVVLGAVLSCNMGRESSAFTPCGVHSVESGPSVIGTMLDHEPGEHLLNFGKCDVDKRKCKPVTPLPWDMVWTNSLTGGTPPLTQSSKLRCYKAKGAEITVAYAGQEDVEFCEEGPRFDATYVDPNGHMHILRGVTRSELEEYERKNNIKAGLDKIDAYRENPLGYIVGPTVSGLASRGRDIVEERNKNIRNSRPFMRPR